MKEILFDLHCDLPTKVYLENKDILHNDCHWSLDKCEKYDIIQLFACFVDQTKVKTPYSYIDSMIDNFKAKANSVISNYFLSIEGGEALEGDIENLTHFHKKGVKLLTLTWNFENELGYGAHTGLTAKPLKKFGLNVVKKMNELNMVVDVSHLNEGGFWSVAEYSAKPFVATHSNAFKICPNIRNLTDEQISCIIENNGLIGINLYPPFLNERGEANVSDILKHIEYILSLGAENNIALGCDFDGIDSTPLDIKNISDIDKLFLEMQKNNFSDEIIAKIRSENCKNFIKKHIL